MELKQIHIFALLAEHLNFSRVADIYNMSQSAISKQLSLLEYDLGGKLFERDTRSVVLSELGHTFLPYAKQIIMLEEEALAAADACNQDLSHEMFYLYVDSTLLSSSVSLHFPEKILRAAQRFQQKYPCYMQNHIFPEYEWRATVKFKMFDMALVRLPIQENSEPAYSSLKRQNIYTIQQYLIVHDPRNTYETLEEAILSLDVLLLDRSICTGHPVSQFIAHTGSTVRLSDCDNWNNLFLRLMSSRSATIVPENALSYFDQMDVQIFPLKDMGLETCIYAYWQKDDTKDSISGLVEALLHEFSGDNLF